MKIAFLIYIIFGFTFTSFAQTVKEIRSDIAIDSFNEEGELTKQIFEPGSEFSTEWTYEYIKDSSNRLLTKKAFVYGNQFQTFNYQYRDTLVIQESIHQLTKFGMTVYSIFYTYSENGHLMSAIKIDSLQSDTISITEYSISKDTIITTERTKKFKQVIKELSSEAYKYKSEMLISLESGEVSSYEISLVYPENEQDEIENLYWQESSWNMNGHSAYSYKLFGKEGYAIKSSTRNIKNKHGDVIRVISTTEGKEEISDFSIEYY